MYINAFFTSKSMTLIYHQINSFEMLIIPSQPGNSSIRRHRKWRLVELWRTMTYGNAPFIHEYSAAQFISCGRQEGGKAT